ncbi:unnamed protein product [Cochlearia groenlandica]
MSSFNGNNSNIDNLLIQTLLGRLQIRPPNSHFLSQSLDDLLFKSDESDGDEDGDGHSNLDREESKLEKELIRVIVSGRSDSLKPNSGQAVTVNEHHICVGFHEDEESDYRVWEWHGHIMLFDEDNGYTPEYIYGNYFERLPVKLPKQRVDDKKKKKEMKEDEVENLGLRELIDGGDAARGRVLHRNITIGSSSLSMIQSVIHDLADLDLVNRCFDFLLEIESLVNDVCSHGSCFWDGFSFFDKRGWLIKVMGHVSKCHGQKPLVLQELSFHCKTVIAVIDTIGN